MTNSKQVNADGVVIPTLFGGAPYQPKPKKILKDTHNCIGSKYTVRAKLSFTENGEKVAEPGERLDLDGMIQAALPSTDIAAIVACYKAGDESVLHVNPGFIGDAVSLPKDLYDYKAMNDLYDRVAGSFNTLPDEVKALFGNNVEDYLNSIISNKAEKIISDFKASQAVAPEAKEGE